MSNWFRFRSELMISCRILFVLLAIIAPLSIVTASSSSSLDSPLLLDLSSGSGGNDDFLQQRSSSRRITTSRARLVEPLLLEDEERKKKSFLDECLGSINSLDELEWGVPTVFQDPRQQQSQQSMDETARHTTTKTTWKTPKLALLLDDSDNNNVNDDANNNWNHNNIVHSNAVGDDHTRILQMQGQKFKKTGTTIAGCVVAGHVLLAADTRATEATMVADKACQKLHPLATNCWCAGAGTSSDLDHLTNECLFTMALERLQDSTVGNDGTSITATDTLQPLLCKDDEEEEQPFVLVGAVSIEVICHYLQQALYGSNLGANLILGGIYNGQPYLRAIHPHGSMDVDLPFAALGSGGLNAMAVLEQGYRGENDDNDNMTLEEGIALVQKAIVAGVRNDLGSGSQVDLVIIRPDGTSQLTRCVVPEQRIPSEDDEESNRHAVLGQDSHGVNGFGNLPFAIQSKNVRLTSTQTAEEERAVQWNKILGLDME